MNRLYRVLVLLLLLALPPALQSAVAPDFVTDYAQSHGYSGSILLQQPGKPLYRRSFGLASRAFKQPNTPDTRYRIASITKAFTAVLVLQLVEQGKLDLQQPIRRYLPAYAGNGGDKVTLHQLLNHTSGLPNFDQVKDLATALSEGVPNYQKPRTSTQLMADYCSGDLVAEPGKAFDYNNCDYIVLGKIVEAASGKPYADLLRERIAVPLGLKHTGLLQQSDIVEGLADTYMYREDLKSLANDLPVYAENWFAAGSLYSTVDDVLAFADGLFDGKLLSAESLQAMTTPGLDDYGYGVWSYEMTIAGKKQRIVKRPGRIMGAQTQLFRMRDAGITLILLANTDAVDLDEFAAAVARRGAD